MVGLSNPEEFCQSHSHHFQSHELRVWRGDFLRAKMRRKKQCRQGQVMLDDDARWKVVSSFVLVASPQG